MTFANFFFLRPGWLFLLVPMAMLLIILVRRRNGATGDWQKLVDPHLLKKLAVRGGKDSPSRWLIPVFGAALAAAVIAMAGPTWQKIDTPAYRSMDPVVVVMSLAQSMNATDVSPSRVQRASHKVRDILDTMKGYDTGLIVYADRPFVAAPLTTDAQVIREMLPELSTDLMPVLGNRLDLAIDNASDLLTQAGARKGMILVIADDAGTAPEAGSEAARKAVSHGYSVSVLGVGSTEGAKLQTASGQEIHARDGSALSTKLEEEALKSVAQSGGGTYATLTPDNSDIKALLPVSATRLPEQSLKSDMQADAWNDMGYWLLLIPLFLAPLAFRKGVLMAVPFALALVAQAPDAVASETLWQTPDQLAATDFRSGDFTEAAETFVDKDWKAAATYKVGNFGAAADLYTKTESPDGAFNRGNALARAGQFEEAIAAYDDALASRPGDADAKFNRDLVAKLLEEQQKQAEEEQDKAQQESGGQPQDEASDNQQKSDKSDGDQQQEQAGQSGQQDAESEKPSDGAQQSGQSSGDEQQADAESDAKKPGEGQAESTGQSQNEQTAGQPNEAGKGEPQSDSGGDQNAETGQQQSAQAGSEQRDAGDLNTEPNGASQGALKPGQARTEPGEENRKAATAADSNADENKSAFREAMDALLHGNGTDPQPEQAEPTVPASGVVSERDQAVEQQLRAVPDDPSGLLKARIRQHYARLRARSVAVRTDR